MSGQDNSLKRQRSDEDDHPAADDDDVSLVSRSPSPVPMDVDNVSKYDEFHRGAERERITVDTRIKSTNKGFSMLAKLGWVEGQPLGLSSDGRVDPVPFYVKTDLTGLGKTSQDVRMIETTVAQRRELDSERQRNETEEQRRAREENVARRSALESEISSTLRPFYCTLCDKQFKTVTQYDEHTNSYAHHHKARLKDMQANARIFPKEEVDKRKEKERKREEKELRKIAAANGIRMHKPAGGSTAMAPLAVGGAVESAAASPDKPSSGWVALPAASGTQSSGFKRSGWATVSGTPSTTTQLPLSNDTPPPPSSGGWQKVSSTPSPPLAPSAPTFRTGGWTSLSGDSVPSPSSPQSFAPQPPPLSHPPVSAAQPVRSGWQQFNKSGPKRR
ncbi:hypothetical protein APHAL10511_006543 [Amanita phalloides]|nr:hypothetical protein APHAL10511_006543 [Amanita phalloides]